MEAKNVAATTVFSAFRSALRNAVRSQVSDAVDSLREWAIAGSTRIRAPKSGSLFSLSRRKRPNAQSRHIETVPLDDLRRMFGWRWSHCSDSIFEVGEIVLRESLGEEAQIKRRGNTFFVYQPGLSRRQAHRRAVRAHRRLTDLVGNTDAVKSMKRFDRAEAQQNASATDQDRRTEIEIGELSATRLRAKRVKPLPVPGGRRADPAVAERRNRPKDGEFSAEDLSDIIGRFASGQSGMPRRQVPTNAVSRQLENQSENSAEPTSALLQAMDAAAMRRAAHDAASNDISSAHEAASPAVSNGNTVATLMRALKSIEENAESAAGTIPQKSGKITAGNSAHSIGADAGDRTRNNEINFSSALTPEQRAAIDAKIREREARVIARGMTAAIDNLGEWRDNFKEVRSEVFPPPKTRFLLNPMWIARRSAILCFTITPIVKIFGNDEVLTVRHAQKGHEAQNLIELDLMLMTAISDAYDAIQAQLPCNVLMIPIHESSLHFPQYRDRIERLLLDLPERIRRTFIFEIIGIRDLVKEEQLKTCVGTLLKYGRGVIARVPVNWTDFPSIDGIGLSGVGISMHGDQRPLSAIEVDSEIFSTLARRAKLTSYAIGLSPAHRTIVKDAGLNVFEGDKIELSDICNNVPIPPAKLDFIETMIGGNAASPMQRAAARSS